MCPLLLMQLGRGYHGGGGGGRRRAAAAPAEKEGRSRIRDRRGSADGNCFFFLPLVEIGGIRVGIAG